MSYQGLLFIASWRNRCSGKGAGLRPGDSALTGLLRQSDSLVVCEVDPELKEKLRKFRFRKETDNAAIISECHLPPEGLGVGTCVRAGLMSLMEGKGI